MDASLCVCQTVAFLHLKCASLQEDVANAALRKKDAQEEERQMGISFSPSVLHRRWFICPIATTI